MSFLGVLVVLDWRAGGADFPTQTQVDGLLVVLVWRAGGVDFPTQTQVDGLLVVVVWRAGGVDLLTQTRKSIGCWWWWFGVLVVRIFQHKHKPMGCWWCRFGVLVVWNFQHKRKSLGWGSYALSPMPHHTFQIIKHFNSWSKACVDWSRPTARALRSNVIARMDSLHMPSYLCQIVTYGLTLLLYEISCFKIWVTLTLKLQCHSRFRKEF